MKAHRIDFDLWQRAFHDRIITSDDGLWRARRYIYDNPKNYKRKRESVRQSVSRGEIFLAD
jgi:hypothetical protein